MDRCHQLRLRAVTSILHLLWYRGGDLNPHAVKQRTLKPSCLPFHHSYKYILCSTLLKDFTVVHINFSLYLFVHADSLPVGIIFELGNVLYFTGFVTFPFFYFSRKPSNGGPSGVRTLDQPVMSRGL